MLARGPRGSSRGRIRRPRNLPITLIAAWFNYINRVADALGVGRDLPAAAALINSSPDKSAAR